MVAEVVVADGQFERRPAVLGRPGLIARAWRRSNLQRVQSPPSADSQGGTFACARCRVFMDRKIRRIASRIQPSEERGELNVVPFLDIIINVMMFVLATLAVTFTSTADVSPPGTKPSRSE